MNKTYSDTLKSIMTTHDVNMGKEVKDTFHYDLDLLYANQELMMATINDFCASWEREKDDLDTKDYSTSYKFFVQGIHKAANKYQNELLNFLVNHNEMLSKDDKENFKIPADIVEFLEFSKSVNDAIIADVVTVCKA